MLEVPIFIINLNHRGPYFGEPEAKVLMLSCYPYHVFLYSFKPYVVLGTVSGFSAIWSLTAITVERSWVIHSIVMAKQFRTTMNTVRGVVLFICISAIATSLPPLMGHNKYIYEVRFFIHI